MGSMLKKCRVCGKEYEACRSANRGASVFRWREVACSPECGAVYLAQINASRENVQATKKTKKKRAVLLDAENVQGTVANIDLTQEENN